MAASAIVHRFHEIAAIATATISQAAPIHLDVTQSQLTVGEALDADQPNGRLIITNTDSRAARNAKAANPSAMVRVVRKTLFRVAATTQV
jgi:hypothetical protein